MTSKLLQVRHLGAYTLVFAGIIASILFGTLVKTADSSSADNLSGYAWSDTIGWISFNCTDTGTCATSPYGVNVSSTGALSGYAWSEHIGWVSFNAADVAGCPAGTCAPTFNKSTGVVTGWAKALSGGGGNSGGWDGFLSLSGDGYGVTATACAWGGYAWGSDVVGWVSFSGAGYGVQGTGSACMQTDPDLVSSAIVVPAVIKAGTGGTVSATVTNESDIPAATQFFDNFTYQWDGTGGTWLNFPGNGVQYSSGLGAHQVGNDAVSFSIPVADQNRVGNLYIQHCVDATNAINEGSNETPNCTVSSAIRVISGDLAASLTAIEYQGTTTLTWSTQNTTGLVCEMTGDSLPARTAHSGTEMVTLDSGKTYTLACGVNAGSLVLLDAIGITVDVTPELTASPRTVAVGDNTTLTADLNGQNPVDCTLVGGGKNYDLTTATIFTETIEARTTFTLTCPIGSDTVTVDVVGRGFET